MKALSIRQPWAWLILHGGKDVENRSWPTSFRGRFLIHAAKACGSHEKRAIEIVKDLGIEIPEQLDRGGIVGEVEIVDCVNVEFTDFTSLWFNGPFGFVLNNPKPLPFRPCKGALGFFTPEGVQ